MVVVGAFGLVAAGIAVAGAAWACSPDGVQSAPVPSQGPARTLVTVQGEKWDAASLEVRWESPTGQVSVLARPPVPAFTTQITVPADATPGLYLIDVWGNDTAGQWFHKAQQFEVTGPNGAGTPVTTPVTQNSTSFSFGAPARAVSPEPAQASAPVSPARAAPAVNAAGAAGAVAATAPAAVTSPSIQANEPVAGDRATPLASDDQTPGAVSSEPIAPPAEASTAPGAGGASAPDMRFGLHRGAKESSGPFGIGPKGIAIGLTLVVMAALTIFGASEEWRERALAFVGRD